MRFAKAALLACFAASASKTRNLLQRVERSLLKQRKDYPDDYSYDAFDYVEMDPYGPSPSSGGGPKCDGSKFVGAMSDFGSGIGDFFGKVGGGLGSAFGGLGDLFGNLGGGCKKKQRSSCDCGSSGMVIGLLVLLLVAVAVLLVEEIETHVLGLEGDEKHLTNALKDAGIDTHIAEARKAIHGDDFKLNECCEKPGEMCDILLWHWGIIGKEGQDLATFQQSDEPICAPMCAEEK